MHFWPCSSMPRWKAWLSAVLSEMPNSLLCEQHRLTESSAGGTLVDCQLDQCWLAPRARWPPATGELASVTLVTVHILGSRVFNLQMFCFQRVMALECPVSAGALAQPSGV